MGNERAESKRGFVIVTAAMLGLAAPACVSDPPASYPPKAYSSGGATVVVNQPGYTAQPTYYNNGAAVATPVYGRMGAPPVATPVQPVYRPPQQQYQYGRMGGGYPSGGRMGGGYSGGGRMYK
jgi:hypothetical protein